MAGLPPPGDRDQESQVASSLLSAGRESSFHDAMYDVPVADEVGPLENTGNDCDAGDQAADSQDRNPSLIEETQFVALEVDSQAETQASDPSAYYAAALSAGQPAIETADDTTNQDEDRDFYNGVNSDVYVEPPSICTGAVQPENPAAESSASQGFIRRPVIDDTTAPENAFKFVPPSKPPMIRQQTKTSQNAFNAKISAATISSTAFEPESQAEPAIPQTATESLTSKSKDCLINPHSVSQKEATQKTRVSGQVPEHGLGQGGTAQNTLSVPLDTKQSQALRHHAYAQFENLNPIAADTGIHTTITQYALTPHILHHDRKDEFASERPQLVQEAGRPTSPIFDRVQAGRRMTGQQKTHRRIPLAPLPVARNGGSTARKSLSSRLAKVPFPEASDFPTDPYDGPAVQQQEAVDMSNTFSSGELPTEKWTRNPGPDLSQPHRDLKEGQVVAGFAMAAHTCQTSARPNHQLSRPVQGNSFTYDVNGSSPNLPSHGADQYAGFDQDQSANCLEQHLRVQEHPIANAEVPHSPFLPPVELTESSEHIAEVAGYPRARNSSGEHHELSQNEVRDLDGATWRSISDTTPRKEYSDPDDPRYFQDISRPASRSCSEARSESRRSNQGRMSTRPVRSDNLNSRAPSARTRHHRQSVMKAAVSQKESTAAAAAPIAKNTSLRFRQFLQFGQEFQEAFIDCEKQKAIIESKNFSIKELQQSNENSRARIDALEADKADLALKLKRFADMGSKYKNHMNEVVIAQKHLTAEAAAAKLKAAKEVAILKKIENAIKEAKDIRVPAEKLQTLTGEIIRLKKDIRELSIVRGQNERLEEVNKKLLEVNVGFETALHTASKTEESLKAEVHRKAQDLTNETRCKERAEKHLEDQVKYCRELVEQLKQLPCTISEQLQNENSILAKILGAEKATLLRVDEVASLVHGMRADERKPPASLVELIENTFSRLETKKQNSDAEIASLNEATAKALEMLSEKVNQVCLDEDIKTRYHVRISTLEKANGTLTTDKVTCEHEVQNLTQQLGEARQELADCQEHLRTRECELEVARAVPKEDPRLKSKIQELECAKNNIESQLDSLIQELSRANDEIKSAREDAARKVEQIKCIEQKLHHAQKATKAFNDDRDKYIAAKEHENKAACQELAKKAESQKETMRVKLESQVNNAKQRYEEKELELVQVQQKLQEIQAQLDAQNSEISDHEGQRAEYIQATKEQMVQVQRLIERALSQKIPLNFTQELQSIMVTTKESRSRFDMAIKQLPQIVETATEEQRRIETKIRKVGALEIEKYDLESQRSALQSKVEELSRVGVWPQRIPNMAGLSEPSANASPNLPPPAPNFHQTKIDLQKGMSTTPRSKWNSEAPGHTRRAVTQSSEHKTSLRSTGTGETYGRINGMATPQILANMSLGSSRSAGCNSSQQQVPASQNSGNSNRSFAALFASSSPLSDIESPGMIESPESEDANKSAMARTKSKATLQGTSAAQSNFEPIGTSNIQPREVQQERKVSFSNTNSKSPSRVAMRAKSAMKFKQNPYLDEETSMVNAAARKEESLKGPRPTLGMDQIRGLRSGNGAGPASTIAQQGKQHPTVRFEEPRSPLPGPIDRYQKPKRPHEDQDSNSARKRTTSVQRSISSELGSASGKRTASASAQKSNSSRSHLMEILDSQDREYTF